MTTDYLLPSPHYLRPSQYYTTLTTSTHLVDDEHAPSELERAVQHPPQEHLADALLKAVAHLLGAGLRWLRWLGWLG